MIATGFITGWEKDPTIPNSNCYTYYPVLQDQVSMIVNELNYTLLIPTNLFKFIDDSATLINRYSLFQNYCQAATLLTKLDNVFQTIEGVTGLLYKVVLNYAQLMILFGTIANAYNQQQWFNMAKGAGQVFSLLFDFQIPDDIV